MFPFPPLNIPLIWFRTRIIGNTGKREREIYVFQKLKMACFLPRSDSTVLAIIISYTIYSIL
jgi:hypothetical protein